MLLHCKTVQASVVPLTGVACLAEVLHANLVRLQSMTSWGLSFVLFSLVALSDASKNVVI